MDFNCLKEEWDPILKVHRYIQYQKNFKKEHPYFFEPCGTLVFCGSQGSGKTLSTVNYIYQLWEKYPRMIVCTNITLTDYPFNARYVRRSDGQTLYYRLDTGEQITQDDILSGNERVCIEYDGLDCLKYVNNGEYGVCFVIDEIHLELNSLESKNIDIDVMTEISQQRKQRKHIVGTSQVFMRMAKPLREQMKNVVICKNFFKILQFNKLIDAENSYEEDGKLKADVKHRFLWLHDPAMYQRYDTYAKMKRYNKEWQGHKREVKL